MKKCLIIGYGSIGARHARILHGMGHQVVVVTQRRDAPFPSFAAIKEAGASAAYDLAIVSSPTVRHADDGLLLSKHVQAAAILFEKPIFASLNQQNLCPVPFAGRTRVAYNLRFHPIISRLREIIQRKKVYSATFYVGQYLPDWRPGSDYRNSYSAYTKMGGGVLRDLSHELDLACHLTGTWREITALGGHFSNLEITADDVFSTLSTHECCSHVAIHLNYLDRSKRRHMVINHEAGTVCCDLTTGTVTNNGITEVIACTADSSYEAQLHALLDEKEDDACTIEEGLDVLHMVEAAEYAALHKKWVIK